MVRNTLGQVDPDALGLKILVDRGLTAFASDAASLVAAERPMTLTARHVFIQTVPARFSSPTVACLDLRAHEQPFDRTVEADRRMLPALLARAGPTDS